MKVTASEAVLEIPLKQLRTDAALNLRSVNSHDESVRELAESVKQQGILEPLVVRKEGTDGSYRLVFGFRRAAAARLAGLTTVPAIVRKLTDEEIREAQLVENLQREDLNPIDEAKAFKALLETTDLTQAEVGKKIGKSQPYVANRLRLLELPEDGQVLVAEEKISPGVAAELLKLPAAADRERKAVLREAAEAAKEGNSVSPTQIRWKVDAAKQNFTERIRRQKAVETAKFPTCPVKDCGKKGRAPRAYAYRPDFTCSAGHAWDPKTGKMAPKEAQYTRYQPPPPPTLPLVEGDVPTTIAPTQLANRLIEAIQDVAEIRLVWHKGTTAELALVVDLPDAKRLKVPDLEFQKGHKFVSLANAEEYQQRSDADRQRLGQERANLEAWLATFGRKKGAKK